MKYLILVFFSTFASKLISQNTYDMQSYIDSLGVETSEDKSIYTRIVKNYGTNQSDYLFTDYFKSGKPRMIGKSTNKDNLTETGQFLFYYENGKKEKIMNFYEGKPLGKYYSWYSNGEKKIVGEYMVNKADVNQQNILRINQYYDDEGRQKVIDGNGFYFEETDAAKCFGKLFGGFKDSIWTGTEKKIKLSFTEEYKDGNLVKGTSIDSLGNTYHYDVLEVKPVPVDGIESFYKHVGRNFVIPIEASDLRGKIFICFMIEKDGRIRELQILRGVHPLVDNEAARVIFNSPPWQPGIIRGIPRRVKYSLPITIHGSE